MAAPTVSAGSAQAITSSQTLTLTGIVQPGTAPLIGWGWSQVSGPPCIIVSASAPYNSSYEKSSDAIALVYELSAGTYVFQFSATDQVFATSTSTVTITVSSDGGTQYIPPIAT